MSFQSFIAPGARVFWRDPDDGACTRYMVVESIHGDIVRLHELDDPSRSVTVEASPEEIEDASEIVNVRPRRQLTLSVTYDLSRVPPSEHSRVLAGLESNLEFLPRVAMGNGMITGDSEAEVDTWSSQVSPV